MLEPLHACNLTCTGCGRIREYESTITERVPLEECLAAVDECGAPMVSICGGEPMMYPQIGELVAGILERNKHIYLCTNGMFIVKRLHEFTPDQPLLLQRASGRHGKDARYLRGEGRRVPRGHRGHQGRQGSRFHGVHQHHGLQRDRHEGDRGAVRVSQAVQCGRPPDLAGLRLLGRERSRDLHDARRYSREIQGCRHAVAKKYPAATRRRCTWSF